MQDKELGFWNISLMLTQEAERHLIETTEGDARRLLNVFEIGVITTWPDGEG